DAARRHDQATRPGNLYLDAAGPARAAQGGGGRSPRDERRRRDRAADACGATGGTVAGIRTVGAVWARAAALQGPPPARVLRRPHARGSGERRRAPGGEKLSAAAAQPVPDPDQIPRRDPAAIWRDAG